MNSVCYATFTIGSFLPQACIKVRQKHMFTLYVLTLSLVHVNISVSERLPIFTYFAKVYMLY